MAYIDTSKIVLSNVAGWVAVKNRWTRGDRKAIDAMLADVDPKAEPSKEQLEAWALTIMERCLVAWSLDDGAGQPLPLTRKTIDDALTDDDYHLVFDHLIAARRATQHQAGTDDQKNSSGVSSTETAPTTSTS